jgi:hypothetical protein
VKNGQTSSVNDPEITPIYQGNGAGTHSSEAPAGVFLDASTVPYDDIDAAVELPNLDSRTSVLEELPADLFVDYREGFAVREEAVADEIRLGRPGPQEVAHCHPDPGRKKVVWGLRDARNNRSNLYVIPQSVLDRHPRLRPLCKLYVIRQYVTSDQVNGLWAAPLPGPREAASDASHLEAQENALSRWVRVEWTGNRFACYLMSEADGFGEPQFPDQSFEEIVAKGLLKWIVRDAEHPLCKHLLKGTPASQSGAPS